MLWPNVGCFEAKSVQVSPIPMKENKDLILNEDYWDVINLVSILLHPGEAVRAWYHHVDIIF